MNSPCSCDEGSHRTVRAARQNSILMTALSKLKPPRPAMAAYRGRALTPRASDLNGPSAPTLVSSDYAPCNTRPPRFLGPAHARLGPVAEVRGDRVDCRFVREAERRHQQEGLLLPPVADAVADHQSNQRRDGVGRVLPGSLMCERRRRSFSVSGRSSHADERGKGDVSAQRPRAKSHPSSRRRFRTSCSGKLPSTGTRATRH